jgi:trehalose synthase
MKASLERYSQVVGPVVIDQLRQLARPLSGKRVVHVNSTRVGGGVAEILYKLIPLMNELGLETSWEVITGGDDFYQCTKSFHNGLQGNRVDVGQNLLDAYEAANHEAVKKLGPSLEDADFVIIHDPQPAPFLKLLPNRKGKWVWRCHIDASRPHRPVWQYLRNWVQTYDASIFSTAAFAQPLPHPQYLIPPSIDPLSDKNIDLDEREVASVCAEFGLDTERPIITQVSRYDRFKDPVGVIEAYKLAKKHIPTLQLVLAGGDATDDPEGAEVLAEVREAAGNDPDIHVLLLAADAHRTINALQRSSDVVLQKSTREGFGLTVTEALWKGCPVIGGNTGGIRLQIINHQTGFLVDSPEGAALRIRYLLENPEKRLEMGRKARAFVTDNFLLTRHLREYLTLLLALHRQSTDRIEP